MELKTQGHCLHGMEQPIHGSPVLQGWCALDRDWEEIMCFPEHWAPFRKSGSGISPPWATWHLPLIQQPHTSAAWPSNRIQKQKMLWEPTTSKHLGILLKCEHLSLTVPEFSTSLDLCSICPAYTHSHEDRRTTYLACNHEYIPVLSGFPFRHAEEGFLPASAQLLGMPEPFFSSLASHT